MRILLQILSWYKIIIMALDILLAPLAFADEPLTAETGHRLHS